ncbi:MAG: hypothetical protein WCA21_18610 [Terracidiphilus sp.]
MALVPVLLEPAVLEGAALEPPSPYLLSSSATVGLVELLEELRP